MNFQKRHSNGFLITFLASLRNWLSQKRHSKNAWIWSPLNIWAIPKSKILGFISPSKRTLLILRSLCIIFNLESWWRYKIPQAIPMMISKSFPQLSNKLLVWSTIKFNSSILKMWKEGENYEVSSLLSLSMNIFISGLSIPSFNPKSSISKWMLGQVNKSAYTITKHHKSRIASRD